ncbi:MAG: PEGA domain-containing protein, partial [Candidatus Omnitrophica bacterium]|nr:PEGA domain-containing protein [Candidatus Omnitrophota bacterium]
MDNKIRFLVFVGLALFIFGAGRTTAGADGFLYITSVPEKTIIKIDGENQGAAPVSVSLPAGTYFVEASLASYQTAGQKVAINEGEVTRIELKLEKSTLKTIFAPVFTPASTPAGKGNITVMTDWTPAEIYLDGIKRKETPPVTIKGISEGTHGLILVSKGYAIYREVKLKNQETLVFRESFEKAKSGAYQPWVVETKKTPTKEEIEQKRQALPSTVKMKLTSTAQKKASKDSSNLWNEGELVVVTLQYRKSGTETWEKKELQIKTKEEDAFTIGKGTYDVQLILTHYKVASGLLTVLIESEKKKDGEVKEQFKKEFAADKLYTFDIVYDGTIA